MIIFDLDGTLADCEHRRHFVDHRQDQSSRGYVKLRTCDCECAHENDPWIHKETGKKWKADFQSFYEACDRDTPIQPTINIFTRMDEYSHHLPIQIWSARCESVRDKTIRWLEKAGSYDELACVPLKMRSIGNTEPDEVLKERWLDEHIAGGGKPIEFVFDDRPKVIRMWQRRGIFVFNCSQKNGEF